MTSFFRGCVRISSNGMCLQICCLPTNVVHLFYTIYAFKVHSLSICRSLLGILEIILYIFFRCLRPNTNLSAMKFDSELVQRQMICNGVMEIAELRREGYPIRIKFKEFSERLVYLYTTHSSSSI